jgi:hypothetical protein
MGSSPSLDAIHRSVSISGCCRQYDDLCALSLAGAPLRGRVSGPAFVVSANMLTAKSAAIRAGVADNPETRHGDDETPHARGDE